MLYEEAVGIVHCFSAGDPEQKTGPPGLKPTLIHAFTRPFDTLRASS
jgi:hypothetical protein